MEKYIKDSKLQKITEEEKNMMDSPISKEEIEKAIDQTKLGKAPGPDGFTAKFYKTFKTEISHWLQLVGKDIQEGEDLPQTWQKAIITMIPKTEEESPNVKNFRPISLLNTDYKIFTKVIAERLKKILIHHIEEDQAGFLPGRYIRDNLRTAIDCFEYGDKNTTEKLGFLFLDAEKAFDNVNWIFMEKIFRDMAYGDKFLNVINKIYSKQSAEIKLNNELTESFPVQKGTRQGCPLSPLLFIAVLEILLKKISNDKDIEGIKIKNYQFKYRAFADDIVFFVQDPERNFPKLFTKIEEFGQYGGFYINKSKSKILLKNTKKATKEEIEKITGCDVVNKVKYLGIDLTNKNLDIFKNNYERIWKRIKEDMMKWNSQNLSLFGRIAAVKMNVLPRMLYLFQTVPIIKKKEHFNKWKRDITTFIWAGKKARIKYKILIDSKERGGLQLPDLQLYYDACCLLWSRDWILLNKKKMLALEGFNKSFGWHAYLMYDKVKADAIFNHHFIRRSILQCWLKHSKETSDERPMWIAPEEVIHKIAETKGADIDTYEDLLTTRSGQICLKSENELKEKYNWWLIMQIKNLFNSDKKKFGFRKQKSKLELVILGEENKLISKIYKVILERYTADEVVKEQMTKWAVNINSDIMMDQWEYLWQKTNKISACTSLQENSFKMIYRWYMTPKKLARIDRTHSNRCWKCKKHEGSLFHMWWTCSKARKFWTKIHKKLQQILKIKINKNPTFFLLGIDLREIDKEDRTLTWYSIVAARLTYAKYWKTEKIPKTSEWMEKLMYLAEMDKITKKLREQNDEKYKNDWIKLKKYTEKKWKSKNLSISLERY